MNLIFTVRWDGGSTTGFICRGGTGLRKVKGKLRVARQRQQATQVESGHPEARTLLLPVHKVAIALGENLQLPHKL